MEKKFITAKEAISILPERKEIHTFYCNGMGLIGADWDREDILEEIGKIKNVREISGNEARSLGHGLAVYEKGCKNLSDVLFIETDEEKLNALDPIQEDANHEKRN